MTRFRYALPVLLATSGCGHLLTSTAPTDSDAQVCERYGRYLHTRAFQDGPLLQDYAAEIKRRDLLTPEELAAVQSRQIGMGMSECVMFASWGAPTRANRAAWQGGHRTQYVYRDLGYYASTRRFVYVEAGKIVGWQN
jgi:hypothetical protein